MATAPLYLHAYDTQDFSCREQVERNLVEGGGKPVLALLTDVQVNHVNIQEIERRGDGRTETDGKPKLHWR